MTTKTKKKKVAPRDPEFASQWADSQIGLSKSAIKIVKLFRAKSVVESSCPQSPLGWFVDESVNKDALEKIDLWYQSLRNQTKLRQHFVDVRRSVERLTSPNVAQADTVSGQLDLELEGNRELELAGSLIAVAASHSLRTIAGNGPLMEWNGLVTRLLELSKVAEANVGLSPAAYQILAIEMPLTIAFQLPKVENHQQLAARCADRLQVSIEDMLDHDGWPHARYLDEFGVLASSWVRCGLLFGKMKIGLGPDSSSQLEWVVRQLLRTSGPDGRNVFASRAQRAGGAELDACLKRLSSDIDDEGILKLRRSGRAATKKAKVKAKAKAETKKSGPRKGSSKKLPPVSCISDWGESGILRSHWGLDSPLVGFDFSSNSIRLSVARSEHLIAGVAMPEISINSATAVADRDFEVVCEQSDKDVEYVELETDLGEGGVFNRQILLSRDEEFLLIADVVVPSERSRIDYRCRYRLAPGVVGMQETENREVYLRTSGIQSLVLPLALPEWKVARCDDRLEFDETSLSLVQSTEGRGLYAPLFFDLNPKRSRRKRTWRQLTVGENLKAVPSDVACAYRVQLDEQQWCFYRAINGQANRTFLGENVIDEFVFNRFKKDGTVKALLRV